MRLQHLVLVLLTGFATTSVQAQIDRPHLVDRNILGSRYDLAYVMQTLVSHDAWEPLPTIDDREPWGSVPEKVRRAHLAAAESLAASPLEALRATRFLDFVRTGDRSAYQRIIFQRRERLAALVIAELLENEGRFVDEIVDMIWLISEETYWGMPAHLDLQTAGFGLPDVDEPTVDLLAAETGALLSWTLYLLEDRLHEVSPLVPARVKAEVKRRMLEPLANRDDFWWMGFDPTVVNNWTPWVGSNWLAALLIVEEDKAERAYGVHKVLRTLDVFLNSYPDDGGCDEGPTYWNRAGGSLLDALEILHSASGGSISIYDEPLVVDMGRFIYRSHVGGPYFINFADASPRVVPDPVALWLYGKRTGDQRLVEFAGFIGRESGLGEGFVHEPFGSILRQLRKILSIRDLAAIEARQPLIRDVWLPDLEVMAAREFEGTTDGFYLAAKAGHNGENHNHNDVGNFIVYESGRPVIIDVGPGTYTRTTFSSDRYSVWNFQSDYHNVPTINGVMQMNGSKFSSRDVAYNSDGAVSELRQEIAGAYPEAAGVSTWLRSVGLDRGKRAVVIRDEFELTERREPPRLNFMTALDVATDDGVVRLLDDGFDDVVISFDNDAIQVVVDTIGMGDERLRAQWGDRLHRIVFESKGTEARGTIQIVMSREPDGRPAE